SRPDERVRRVARSLGRLERTFGEARALEELRRSLGEAIAGFARDEGLDAPEGEVSLAARYLAAELMADPVRFATSAEAIELAQALLADLERRNVRAAFLDDL